MRSALLLALVASSPGLAAAAELRIADREPGAGIARVRPNVFALRGQRVEISLVVLEGRRASCAGGPRLAMGAAAPRPCRALEPGQLTAIRWYLAEPEQRGYDNFSYCKRGRGCPQPIHYRLVEIRELRGRTSFEVKEVPRLASPGTRHLAARARYRGSALTTPCPLPARPTTAAAVAMTSIVIRRDNSYVGFLTELLGVPYAFAPRPLGRRGHQTDLRLATDCIALAIYGQRRLGRRTPYLPLSGLDRHTRAVCQAGSVAQLLSGAGRRCGARVRMGDLLHLGRHVVVMSRDLPPEGKLGPKDLVIHALFGAAEEIPLGRLLSDPNPVRVLRWARPIPAGRPSAATRIVGRLDGGQKRRRAARR